MHAASCPLLVPLPATRCLRRGIVLTLAWLLATAAAAVEPPLTAVAFTPDGGGLVAVSQSGLHEFSWPDLQRKRTIAVAAANLHSVAFTPGGEWLAVGGGDPAEAGGYEIFSWPDASSAMQANAHQDSVRALVWRNANQLLTASIDREIKLCDIANAIAVQRTLRGHSRGVGALCLLPDQRTLISAGDDRSVRVWDLQSGTLIRSLDQHTGSVHALALRPAQDGLPMVASAAGDRTIRLWQPTIGRMVRYARLAAEPLDIAWLNDGQHIAAACADGRLRVVHADEVRVTAELDAIDGWAYTLAVHPTDGTAAIAGTGGQVRRIPLVRDR